MRITSREYLLNKIDTDIPDLSPIPSLIHAGKMEEAEHVYAQFVRARLQPEKYFRIPYYPAENVWMTPSETEEGVFLRLERNAVVSCGYRHDFGPGGIRWEDNPTPNHYTEWPWQLNRHHEFRMLGHLYRQTGDERIAELFVRMFTSWREQCVCPDNISGHATISWRTIEIGIRLVKNWHYALHAFCRAPAFTDHVLCEFFASMWENAWRLRHFPTLGNWLVMEMAGLYHAGLLYPWVREAAEWKEYALGRLTAELDIQIYPDGFQYELSTNYHQVVLENYGYVSDIARAMGEPLPPSLMKGLEKAWELYVRLSDPALRLPDINDGLRADAAALCEKALELFPEREDFRYFATRRAQGKPPEYTDTVLPYSGMAVLRDSWQEDSQWAFFESAPFGRGHQHEDKLNFLLHAYGRDLLRDTGNFAYDTSDMRMYVLSAYAHNTALVDGMGQNRRDGYNWEKEDIRKLSDLRVELGADADIVRGVYGEGFGPEHVKVTHRRTVAKIKNHPLGLKTFYLVVDRLTAEDGREHRYDVHWQLEAVDTVFGGAPGGALTGHEQMNYLAPLQKGSRITADYGDGVTLTLVSGENCALRCGSFRPFLGWRTPNVPAPAIDFTAWGRDARIVTLLYPSDEGCPVRSLSYDPSPDGRDVTVRADGGEWTFSEP